MTRKVRGAGATEGPTEGATEVKPVVKPEALQVEKKETQVEATQVEAPQVEKVVKPVVENSDVDLKPQESENNADVFTEGQQNEIKNIAQEVVDAYVPKIITTKTFGKAYEEYMERESENARTARVE